MEQLNSDCGVTMSMRYLFLENPCIALFSCKTYALGNVYSVRLGSWNVTANERDIDSLESHVYHIVLFEAYL